LANFSGRGLVSEDNRLMKSLNHDTCHLSRHDCDVKKMADDKDADAFMLLYFFTAKQCKKADHMGPPLVTRQVSNLLVVHFIGWLSLETKPHPRSWPTLSIVWRQLKSIKNKCHNDFTMSCVVTWHVVRMHCGIL